jgi:hypothetical protein
MLSLISGGSYTPEVPEVKEQQKAVAQTTASISPLSREGADCVRAGDRDEVDAATAW